MPHTGESTEHTTIPGRPRMSPEPSQVAAARKAHTGSHRLVAGAEQGDSLRRSMCEAKTA